MATGTPVRGNSYVITPGQHLLRALMSILSWVTGLIIIVITVKFFSDSYYWSLFLGVWLWALGVAATIRWRIAIVVTPEVSATIITNSYMGVDADPFRNQIVLTTGTWFKFWWEQEVDGLIINMREVPQEFDEDFPCEDGVPIRVRGSFTYRPDVDLLPRYIAVDDDVINKGLVNLATGRISRLASQHPAETARGMIQGFQDDVVSAFDNPTIIAGMIARGEARALAARGGWSLTLEHIYGISFNQLQVGDVAYSDAYQLVLEQRARSRQVDDAITRHATRLGITPGSVAEAVQVQALTSAVLAEFGIINVSSVRVEGDMGQGLAAILAGIAGFFTRRP